MRSELFGPEELHTSEDQVSGEGGEGEGEVGWRERVMVGRWGGGEGKEKGSLLLHTSEDQVSGEGGEGEGEVGWRGVARTR